MLARNEITDRGAMPAEICVPPEPFFKHLAERDMHSCIKITTPIA
jgi:hypothetical protein